MKPPWRRVKEVFEQVIAADDDQQSELLNELCGDDSDLRAAVEDALAEDALAGPVQEMSSRPDEFEVKPGQKLGNCTIERLLGRGGQGAVHLATWRKDEVSREVAVKVLRREGLGDRLDRFRAERKLLSKLAHASLPALIDLGVVKNRPYLVMEFVDGVPFDRYCDGLSLRDRLEAFLGVCNAVEHLHANLIAHRDLKPNNILVQADGTVKVLDLGIAKLLEDGDGDAPETASSTIVLSRESAAPEQYDHRPATTLTDVFSLGLLLYRTLAGRHPFEEELGGEGSLADALLRRQVPAPSRFEGSALGVQKIDSDLDAIALRALQRDPEARYPHVALLAQDIRSYLEGLPVAAARGNRRYLLKKFVGRNRRWVAVTAVLVLLIFGSLGALMVQQGELRRQRDQAQLERQRAERGEQVAEKTSDFLISLVSGGDPWQRAPDASVEELVNRAAKLLEAQQIEDPESRVRLLDTLGLVYRRLGEFDKAGQAVDEALEIARRSTTGLELARALNSAGKLYADQGRFDEAMSVFEEALALTREHAPGQTLEMADCFTQIGLVHQYRREWEPSIDLLRRALEIRRLIVGEEAIEAAYSELNLANSLRDAGDHGEALDLYRRSQRTFETVQGPDHPILAYSANNIAQIVTRRGLLNEAEQLFLRALAIREANLAPGHREIAYLHNNLAQLAVYRGELEAGRDLFQKSQAALEDSFGPTHYLVGISLVNQAEVDFFAGRYREAGEKARRGAEMVRAVAPKSSLLADALLKLSLFAERAGDLEGSAELLDEAAALVRPGSTADSAVWRARLGIQRGRLLALEGDAVRAGTQWSEAERAALRSFEEEQLVEGLVLGTAARLLLEDDRAQELLVRLQSLGYATDLIAKLGKLK